MTDPRGLATLVAWRERRMVDVCRAVTDPDPQHTPELDGNGMPLPGTGGGVVYEGRCQVAQPSGGVRGAQVLDDRGVPVSRLLLLPASSPTLAPGTVVKLLAAPHAPGLVGETLIVAAEDERSWASHRRYRVRGRS